MKRKSILHPVLMSIGLLLSNNSFARISESAPAELKSFIESDFDSIHMAALKTHAVPVKILVPSLILEGRSRGWIAKDSYDFKEVFKKTGLTYPDNVIFNGKSYSFKSNLLPAGLVQRAMGFGIKADVKIANLSCIACHSGAQYDQHGGRINNLIIGAPSDSFNPERYVGVLYQGMKKVNQNWSKATGIMNEIFPDTSIREKLLFKTIIRSQVKSYMKDHAAIDSATPFINGGPGLTNGVASLKNVLGLDVNEGSATSFTSIPSIGDRGFRTSLLYDGVYSNMDKNAFREIKQVTDQRIKDAATIAALFTVPTMGQTPKRALENIQNAVKVISPILKQYKTPEYPGAIDNDRAAAGFKVYNNSCVQCHGQYEWDGGKKSQLVSFPNKLVPQDEMNSDPERWKGISDALVNYMNASSWANIVATSQNKGYVAPILEGLWASAPYMHNGSVPTLWSFMRPETRPSHFTVGSQNLDLDKVGIIGAANLESETYNTGLSGRNNQGHEKEFLELSEADKDNLLEYLKTL